MGVIPEPRLPDWLPRICTLHRERARLDLVPAPWDVLALGVPRPFQCQGPKYEVSLRVCLEPLFDQIHQPEEPHLASYVVLGNAWYRIT